MSMYPRRNFKCPFCRARMPIEQYRAFQPWKCPGCGRALQFSAAHGYVVAACFALLTLPILYVVGMRGWWLLGGTLTLWFPATILFIGPLDRIFSPRLEPYRPISGRAQSSSKFLSLFPPENDDDSASGATEKQSAHLTESHSRKGK